MRFHGQRWRYRAGNSLIFVDNAYSLPLWSQERLVVNIETVQETGAALRFLRSYQEPWLTAIGDDLLRVRLRAGLLEIRCSVRLGDKELEAKDTFTAQWRGAARSWPEESAWR